MLSQQRQNEYESISATLLKKVVAGLTTYGATVKKQQPGLYSRAYIDDEEISIEICPPRQYMGRFDAGKNNWTIDLKPHSVYVRMRTQQVRVDIDPIGPVFKSEKLTGCVDKIRAAIAQKKEADKKHKAAQNAIPKLKSDLWAEPGEDGKYKVSLHRNLTIEQIKKLDQFLTEL